MLALIQDVLQTADGYHEQRDPAGVNRRPFAFSIVAHVTPQEKERERTRNHVHIEDPRPGEVVDEDAADRRADGGPDDRSQREDRLTRSQVFDRKGVAQHDLRGREQPAAERALQYAEQN